MKASRWNPADIPVYALLSVAVVGLGLPSFGHFDPPSQTFGSIMVFSRTAFFIAALGVLYQLMKLQVAPKPRRVRVR